MGTAQNIWDLFHGKKIYRFCSATVAVFLPYEALGPGRVFFKLTWAVVATSNIWDLFHGDRPNMWVSFHRMRNNEVSALYLLWFFFHGRAWSRQDVSAALRATGCHFGICGICSTKSDNSVVFCDKSRPEGPGHTERGRGVKIYMGFVP